MSSSRSRHSTQQPAQHQAHLPGEVQQQLVTRGLQPALQATAPEVPPPAVTGAAIHVVPLPHLQVAAWACV